MEFNRFEAQLVVITGAGSGIGRATAIQMAREGAILASADINTDTLAKTLEEVSNASPNYKDGHTMYKVDVRSTEAVDKLVRAVVKDDDGRAINHVFNCAGVSPTNINIEQTSDEYWDRLVDTNLKSVFTMTRACLPHMESGSSFVNVSSVSGLHPSEGQSVYCTTKYAVIGFSKSMALELGPRGIRVNVVCPGAIDTPTNNSVHQGPAKVQAVAETIGLK